MEFLSLKKIENNFYDLKLHYEINSEKEHICVQNIFTKEIYKQQSNIDEQKNLIFIDGALSFNINSNYLKELLNEKGLEAAKKEILRIISSYAKQNRALRRYIKKIENKTPEPFEEIYIKSDFIRWIKYYIEIFKSIKIYEKTKDTKIGEKFFRVAKQEIMESNTDKKFLRIYMIISDSGHYDSKRNSITNYHYYDITELEFENIEELKKILENKTFSPYIYKENQKGYQEFADYVIL